MLECIVVEAIDRKPVLKMRQSVGERFGLIAQC
jgi:hypothetical protein